MRVNTVDLTGGNCSCGVCGGLCRSISSMSSQTETACLWDLGLKLLRNLSCCPVVQKHPQWRALALWCSFLFLLNIQSITVSPHRTCSTTNTQVKTKLARTSEGFEWFLKYSYSNHDPGFEPGCHVSEPLATVQALTLWTFKATCTYQHRDVLWKQLSSWTS